MQTNGEPRTAQGFDLRPRRAGEIVDVAFRLTKQTVAKLWPLLLVVLLPYAYLYAVQIASTSWDSTNRYSSQSGTSSGLTFLGSVAIGLVLVLTVPVMYATHMGKEVPTQEMLKQGLRRIPMALVYAVVAFFVFLLLMIPTSFVLGILIFVLAQIGGFAGVVGIVVVGLLAYIGFSVVLLGLMSRLQLGFIAVVLEDIGPFAAVSRGWRLSAGRWLQFGAIHAGVTVLSSIVLGVAFALGGFVKGVIEGTVGVGIVSFVGVLLFLLCWTPMYTALGVSMYVDGRVRTEALDLQQLTNKLSQAPLLMGQS
jgi:hypothetical protein